VGCRRWWPPAGTLTIASCAQRQRFAEAIHLALYSVLNPRPPPCGLSQHLLVGHHGRNRVERLYRCGSLGLTPELSRRDGDREVRPEVLRHVDALGRLQRVREPAAVVVTNEEREVVPARMIRVERHRAFGQRASAIEVARVGLHSADQGNRVRVSAVECDRPFGGMNKSLAIVLEEVRHRERFPTVLIDRIELERTRQCTMRAAQAVRLLVEPVRVLMTVEMRECGPRRGQVRPLCDKLFERGA